MGTSETDTFRSELVKYLHYNPDTGVFTWIQSNPLGYKPVAGTIAGTISPYGRRVIRFQRRGYFASRLAWLIMTGDWPENEVDHENRIKSDDRWVNLRDLTRQQNCMNKEQTDKRIAKGLPSRERLNINYQRNKYHARAL